MSLTSLFEVAAYKAASWP